MIMNRNIKWWSDINDNGINEVINNIINDNDNDINDEK